MLWMYYVYMLTNWNNKVLYIGMTNNLLRRVYQRKHKLCDGFTKKYNVNKLVYYELYENVDDAIRREKQLKGWKRMRKDALVEAFNPEWKELYTEE